MEDPVWHTSNENAWDVKMRVFHDALQDILLLVHRARKHRLLLKIVVGTSEVSLRRLYCISPILHILRTCHVRSTIHHCSDHGCGA